MTPPHTEPRDFRVYLRSLWRWKWPVLALLLVVPAASYALEARKVQQYVASALVQPDAAALDPALFPTGVSGDDGILAVAALVRTRTIANAAGRLLKPRQTGNAIRELISVEPDTDTGFLTISATAPQPRRAAQIANAFARAISANRAAQSIGRIDAAINGLKRQRARLTQSVGTAAAGNPERRALNEQVQKLRAARSTLEPRQGIVELAMTSTTPVGRNPRRAIELGVLIALLLGAGVIALAESGDRRLRTPDDLAELTELPLLSVIPASAFGDTRGEANEEAFGMLRAALTYFNVDRRLTSIVVASAGQEDGKTTVAVNLAYALAHAGSRVVLVDADLRHPRIGPRLGLAPGGGLADVLSGSLTLRDALVDVSIRSTDAEPTPLHGALKFLPAGTGTANPAELLSSPELVTLLRALETYADYVVVDSAAALAVSDALPLLSAASAIVLVARLNRSTKHAVRRLREVIAAANGTVVGVVATGASARGGYGYGYGYGHSAPPDRRRTQREQRPPKPEKARSRRSRRSRAPAPDPSGNEDTRLEPAADDPTTDDLTADEPTPDDLRWPQSPADSEPQIVHAATETAAETPPQNGQSKQTDREPWTPIIRHTDDWADE